MAPSNRLHPAVAAPTRADAPLCGRSAGRDNGAVPALGGQNAADGHRRCAARPAGEAPAAAAVRRKSISVSVTEQALRYCALWIGYGRPSSNKQPGRRESRRQGTQTACSSPSRLFCVNRRGQRRRRWRSCSRTASGDCTAASAPPSSAWCQREGCAALSG